MAMLAEKKKREKWCLNPRGKVWSDDQTKFGQRLLEKMGWSAGQGLGVNNQGPTDFVKVKKKDDSKGLGFKENGEEWPKTTSEFNELLDQLGGSGARNGEGQADVTSSLEDRSKKSKARVHYHKFTRGKDLSRYSEKDLASIIGPEVVKTKSVGEENDPDCNPNQVNMGSSAEYFNSKKRSKEDQSSQLNNGEEPVGEEVNTKHSNGQSKHKKSNEQIEQPNIEEPNIEDNSKSNLSSKKKMNKKTAFNNENNENVADININNCVSNVNVPKKKKKIVENGTEHILNVAEKLESLEDGQNRIEKVSKKKKNQTTNNTDTAPFIEQTESSQCLLDNVEAVDNNMKKISKKKKKEIANNIGVTSIVEQDEKLNVNQKGEDDKNVKVSKKKKKQTETENKYVLEQGKDVECSYENREDGDEKSISKKKKRQYESNDSPHVFVVDSTEAINNEKLSKKKKKIKDKSSVEENPDYSPVMQTVDIEVTGNEKTSKKKKKKVQDEALNYVAKSNNGLLSEETYENIGVKGVETVSKKKKKKVYGEAMNSVGEVNKDASSEETYENIGTIGIETVTKKKKKKVQDEAMNCADGIQEENASSLANGNKEKKKKKHKEGTSKPEQPQEINKKLEKKRKLEDQTNADSIDKLEEEIHISKKKSRKEKPLETETMNEELQSDKTVILTEQESGDCLEVMGRKTRLKKINIPDDPVKNKKYTTEEFMAFNATDHHRKPERFSSGKTVFKLNHNHQWGTLKPNGDLETLKVYVDPEKHNYNVSKSVIVYEYRLLSKRAHQLNIIVPEVKVIIQKSHTLSKATQKALKILQKSKQIKALLPKNDLLEIEASVNKFANQLQPKIDMMNALLEIENKTASIAEEFVEKVVPTGQSDDLATEETDTDILPQGSNSEQIEELQNISTQLKELLANATGEKHLQHNDKESDVPKQNADCPQISQRKDQVKMNSLQARLETRLKVLAEQMEMLKQGKKPLVLQSLQSEKDTGKMKNKWHDKINNDSISSYRGRGRGPRRGVFSRHSSSFLSIHSDHGGTLPQADGKEFQSYGHQRGRGFPSAVPAGGWGILRSYGETPEGRDSITQVSSRGQFYRGGRGVFRGRGRRGDFRGRGRISQNNYDAKMYAVKCKALNKVPALGFSGVDLTMISGYAATANKTSTTPEPVKKSVEFSEVIVVKNKPSTEISVNSQHNKVGHSSINVPKT